MKCKNCLENDIYPYYGVAPHVHSIDDNGIIYTSILSSSSWPDNYDNIDGITGIYYCPNKDCENSKDRYNKNDINYRSQIWK